MFLRDLIHGIRTLRDRPAVTIVAVLSLAIGLGAATGAASVMATLGFRALAVHSPETLVRVQTSQRHGSFGSVSWADFEDLQRSQSLGRLAAFGTKGGGLSSPDSAPEVVMLTVVSADYFSTLGVSPAQGRGLGPGEAAPGATPSIVISDALWRRRFGGAADIVGRAVTLNNASCVVIGVMRPEFTGLTPLLAPDVWVPHEVWRASMAGAPGAPARDDRWLTVVGRVPSGNEDAGIRRGETELTALGTSLAAAYPRTNAEQQLQVIPELTARRGGLAVVAALLWMVVGLVLLVGCANVAGLLLGRAEERRREMAIRVALGATRGRLVRQLLTEGLVLSAAACGAGLLLGFWIVRSLPRLLPTLAVPLGLQFPFDLRVAAITVATALVTVVIFGLAPSLNAARTGIAQAAGTRSGDSRARGWSPRQILVVAQVAVSFVLLLSGVVFVRALTQAQRIDPGFEVQPMMLMTMAPSIVGYDGPRSRAFFRDLVARVEALPHVQQAGLARRIPLDANGGGASRQIEPPNARPGPDDPPVLIRYNSVSANYFTMMGTQLRQGRAFTTDDTEAAPKVVVINETMARQYWPDGSAVGRTLRVTGAGEGDYLVVGIAQDGKYNSLYETPQPYLFFPVEQAPSGELTLMARTDMEPGAAARSLRDVVQALDPRMPTLQVMTLDAHTQFGSYETRVASIVMGNLAVAGLILSLIGLYSVVAFTVAQRTREIGLRMALGAQSGDIFTSVMAKSLTLAAIGVSAGAGLGWLGTRGLSRSVYGVNPADPGSFIATAVVLVLVSAAATWWPARRATLVDPVNAIRSE